MRTIASSELMTAFARAMGLESFPMKRMVLELEVGKPAILYVKGLPEGHALRDMVKAVNDIAVLDNSEIVTSPIRVIE